LEQHDREEAEAYNNQMQSKNDDNDN
jgi:hypothetical protein